MKISGLWVLFFAVGIAVTVMLLGSSGSRTGYSNPVTNFTNPSGSMTMTTTNRKLKEQGHDWSSGKKGSGYVNVEDYHPIDPVPSSKASIKPGPIEHGTPLIPYIPRPSPPSHPTSSIGASN